MKREQRACATKPPRKQCKHCPWKVSTDPHTIPGGYSEERHGGLANTIASGMESLRGGTMMACHESVRGGEIPCVGWIQHEVDNNNLGVRLAIMHGRLPGDYVLDGEQHDRFEDTLPKPRRRKRVAP